MLKLLLRTCSSGLRSRREPDFFTVPTVTFRTLYVVPILSLDLRRIVHLNVTASPTTTWTSLQLIQAFPFVTAPRYPIRDCDGIYGEQVRKTLAMPGIKEKVVAYRSLWQNGYAGATADPESGRGCCSHCSDPRCAASPLSAPAGSDSACRL